MPARVLISSALSDTFADAMRGSNKQSSGTSLRGLAVVTGVGWLVLVTGCSAERIGPKLTLKVAKKAASNGCAVLSGDDTATTLAAGSFRFTIRTRDGNGQPRICDTIVQGTTTPNLNIPYTGGPIDFMVEAFNPRADGFNRIAAGTLSLNNVKFEDTPPELRLLPTEASRCVPRTGLVRGRAFHTATALPNGQVLLIGGLSTANGAPGEEFFLVGPNNAVEVIDPAALPTVNIADMPTVVTSISVPQLRPRAFHQAAYIGMAEGKYLLVVTGGLTLADIGKPVFQRRTPLNQPGFFRFYPDDSSTAAPTEILTYDPATKSITTRVLGPTELPLSPAAFQGGAQLAAGGIVVAGGLSDPARLTPATRIAATQDGKAAITGDIEQINMMPDRRLGPAVVALDAQNVLVLGGGTDPGAPWLLRAALEFSRPPIVVSKPMITLKQGVGMIDFPTATVLPPSGSSVRVLVSGGLLQLESSNALQPPSLLPLLVEGSIAGPYKIEEVSGGSLSVACGGGIHYRPAAFNAATLIGTGDRVLITGGTARSDGGCSDCEDNDKGPTCALRQMIVYDVNTKTIAVGDSAVGSETLQVPRFGHTQTLLQDGTVLIAGGINHGNNINAVVTDLEIYNPIRREGPIVDGIEIDDPAWADLKAIGANREAGTQAHAPGSKAAVKSCEELK